MDNSELYVKMMIRVIVTARNLFQNRPAIFRNANKLMIVLPASQPYNDVIIDWQVTKRSSNMSNLQSQRGQALVIIALAAVVLFGFAALAIDSSRVYADKRHAQNAADTSAVAAALAKIRQQDFKAVALSRAADNGYANDTDSTVSVNLCNESGVTCLGLPAGANPNEFIRVRITSIVPMTLGRIVGWTSMTNDVEAIARVRTTTPPLNPLTGAGLVAIRNDSSDDCFKVNGSANLFLHDTGIFVNCSGSEALFLNGTANIGMDADAQVAGCTNDLGFPISPGSIQCSQPQQSYDQSYFASKPRIIEPVPTCTGNGGVGATMTPGNFNGTANIPSGAVFPPGTYCFNAGLNLGNPSVTFGGTGAVTWVLSSAASATLQGNANFANFVIYANNADFTVQNSATLNAGRFRFFGIGDSTFSVQGGTMDSSDAYIYSELGKIDINAQADVDLTAPPPGDTFAGVLMYLPWENPNSFELNGGTNNVWTGQILMPHTLVTYNGGANFELHGQVIAYEFIINGGGLSHIYFESTGEDPAFVSPAIELTK
jgi:hypothetical protein